MYKLIALDLDGTLLNDRLVMTSYSREAISRLIDKKIKCIIVTSRMLSSVISIISDLKISYISCLNGALIYNNTTKKIEKRFFIDNQIINKIIKILDNQDITINIFSGEKAYINRYDPDPVNCMYQRSLKPLLINELKLNTKKPSILSVQLICRNSRFLKNMTNLLKSEFSKYLNISESANNYIEIAKKGIDKGTSLEYISRKLTIIGKISLLLATVKTIFQC
jgi:Cof subfamily protein (haloacid dehalogenase superfamily)